MLTKAAEQIQIIRIQAAKETVDYLNTGAEPNKVLQVIGMAPVLPLLSQSFPEVTHVGGPVVNSSNSKHIVEYDSPYNDKKAAFPGTLLTPSLPSSATPLNLSAIHNTYGGPTLRVDNVHHDLSEDDIRVRTSSPRSHPFYILMFVAEAVRG